MKGNSTEFQFILDVSLSLSKKAIKTNDQTYMNITGAVQYGDGYKRPDFFRLGDFKAQLNEKHWFAELDPESGVIKPNSIRKAELAELIAMTPPGTPEYLDLYQRMRVLNNAGLSPASMTKLAQNPQALNPTPPVPGQPPATANVQIPQ
jgi:hypothetical protein